MMQGGKTPVEGNKVLDLRPNAPEFKPHLNKLVTILANVFLILAN